MFNLKNIVNKITDRGRESQPNSPGVIDDPLHNQGAEGFLCPKCMTAYPSPEELQSHYEELHNSVEGAEAAVAGFGVLHQEAGFHLQRQSQGGQSISQEKLSAEIQGITNIAELQKSLMDALESKAQLQFEKESLEQRTAQLARVNAAMKSVNDEEQGKTVALRERLGVLEDQLAHRESIDDAAVLRQELVQVQRVMDEMTRERERERDELQTELQKLKTAYELLQHSSNNSEKVAELQEIIKSEETAKQQLEKQFKKTEGINEQEKKKNAELLAEVANQKKHINELLAVSKADTQSVQKSEQQVEMLKLEVAAAKSSLQEKAAEAEKVSRQLLNTKTEMESLVAKVDSLTIAQTHTASLIKDKDERLVKLAADLKKHASEGAGAAKAAVQQLAEENEARLRELQDVNKQLKLDKKDSDDAAAKAKMNCGELKTKIYELEKLLESSTTKIQTVEAELGDGKKTVESLKNKLIVQEEMSTALKESVAKLEGEIVLEREQLAKKTQMCAELEEKLEATVEECKTLEAEKNHLEVTKTSLETALFEKQRALTALETETQQTIQDLRDEALNLRGDLNVRSILLQDKENELEDAQQDLTKVSTLRIAEIERHEATINRIRVTHGALIEEMTKSIDSKDQEIGAMKLFQEELEWKHAAAIKELTETMEKKTEAADCLQKQLFESENDKASALEAVKKELDDLINKNEKEMAELKSAFVAKSEELKEMQLALDDVTGEKLVLEAHLQTSQTEQKTLMEKYYASSSDNEAQRRNLDEFRRRCEDSQSGLHELGRENQILRMELEKLLGRKWTEDSDVASCHLCHKEFSLLVRKHHCRNCGQIFCNECSAKSAAVANNKKPVRVCDGCYNELASAM